MPQARDEAGNIWETDAQGNPVRLIQAAPQQGRVFADPGAQTDLQQSAATARNTAVNANVNAATQGAQIARVGADATAATREAQTAGLPEGWMWNADASAAVPIPGYSRQGITPEVRQNALQAYSDADAIDAVVQDLTQRFQTGPGATQGIWGLQDYLPTSTNRNFNDAGQRARGYVKRALGFTGGEGNTLAESSSLYDPYLPTAGDTDAQILAKIEALQALGNQSRARAVQILGGRPDANGNLQPVPAEQVPSALGGTLPNAMTRTRFTNNAPQMQTSGDRGVTSTAIPPEMQQEYQTWVLGNASNITPESYVSFRRELDRKYGFQSNDAANAEYAQQLIDGIRNGGTLNLNIRPVEQQMSGMDAIRNDIIDNPVGAGVAGLTNMGSFGLVEGALGDQYNTLRNERGGAVLTGEILGSLAPAAGIARAGGAVASRVAPSLLGGGRLAQIGRGALADATYAGIYGANTGQNPLTSAVEGGVGSIGGQVAGRGLGRVLRGVTETAPVQAMRQAGIPLTVGQTIGGMADRIEQRAMSIPVVGDMLRQRRIDGLEAFNQAAFREAGSPINATTTAIGQEGLDQLGQQVSDAYTTATSGVQVPFDNQFATDFANVAQNSANLPPDARRRLGQVLEARVAPLTDNGSMTGYDYQQARRGLASARNSPPQQFAGFEDIYRNRVTDAEQALTDQMMRGGGQDVVTGLTAANAANRNLRTLEDAANRNLGGSNTDTPQVFMPNQLQRAGLRTQQNFPGPRPFADLADNGQQVLPNTIPNSGTADRLMQMALPSALTGGGAGVGYMAGGDAQSAATGAATPAAVLALLAAASSRAGQRALTGAITRRNPTVAEFGRLLSQGNVPVLGRSPSALFGTALFPAIRTND